MRSPERVFILDPNTAPTPGICIHRPLPCAWDGHGGGRALGDAVIDTTSTWARARAELAKASTFQGMAVKGCSQAELLVVLGSLIQQLQATEDYHQRDLDFFLSKPFVRVKP